MKRISTATEEILGLLISACLGFAAVLLIERLLIPYSEWYFYSSTCWPLLLCHAAGRLSSRIKKQAYRNVICAVSVLAALALIFLMLDELTVLTGVMLALTAIPALILFNVALACVPVYPQGFAIGSVFLYLFEVLFFAFALNYGGATTPLNIFAIISFLLYLFSANVKSIYVGLHATDGKTPMPSGIRVRNTLLLVGFVALSVLIAATGIIQKIISAVFSALLWLYGTVKELLTFEESSSAEASETQIMEAMEPLEDIPVSNALKYFVIGIIMAAVLLCLVLLIMSLIKYSGGRERKPRQKRKKQEYAESDTVDEVESVFDMDLLLERGKKGFLSFAGKFRRRQRLSDMPDAAAKLRFVYKRLLKSPICGENASAKTPLELGKGFEIRSVRCFTEDYSKMKYGGFEADEAQAENAANALRELEKSEHKAHNQGYTNGVI